MQVEMRVRIGEECWAGKKIEMDFAPVAGMLYDDGKCSDAGRGREIIEVTIEHPFQEEPYLIAALERDQSDKTESLIQVYESAGWHIIGNPPRPRQNR